MLRTSLARAVAGERVRFDAPLRMKGDTRMTVDVLLSPLLDEAGGVRGVVASGFDITAREEAMGNVRVLMREINHRSKNVLALTQAIARQIRRHDPDDFFRSFEERLGALAASYDLLVSESWDGVAIESLARAQLAHFDDLVGRRIHFDGPPLTVRAEAAQALGMAFHELATNAGKYGALSDGAGEVRISWETDGDLLTLSWIERGGPVVSAPGRRGFGSVVLSDIVAAMLVGDVEMDYAPEGLSWRLTSRSWRLES
jgi:two-component sensor histidine kinase